MNAQHKQADFLVPGRVRRKFSVGLAIAMLSIALSASATSGALRTSATPRSGGTLTYLSEGLSWPTLDPALAAAQGTSQVIYSLIYGNLFTLGPNDTSVPELATSYTITDHGLAFNLFLRPRVHFQDGTAFNAAAVQSSILRDLNPANGCFCESALKPVTSITTPSNLEVTFHLSVPDGTLLTELTTSGASFISSPTAVATEGVNFANAPVGAGPYKLISNVPNSTIDLQRFTGYWDAKKTYVNQIVITDEASGIAGLETLESGTAQVLTLAEGDSATALTAKRDHSLRSVSTDAVANQVYLSFSEPPFNNVTARYAMDYATNTAELNKSIYDGLAPPTETLVGPDMGGYPGATLPGFKGYNLAKAKSLVASLGGLTFTLNTLGDTPLNVEIGEALQKQWEAAGMNVTLDPLTEPAALAAQEKGDYQAMFAGYPAQGDTSLTLGPQIICPVFFNPAYCDKAASGLVQHAQETASTAGRASLMRRALTLAIVTDASTIPLNVTPVTDVYTPAVHGLSLVGTQQYLAGVWLS